MLPLDLMPERAKEAFAAHQIDLADILMTVRLDLDIDGNFGSAQLAATREKLYVLSFRSPGEDNTNGKKRKPPRNAKKDPLNREASASVLLFEYELEAIERLYLDSFVSSNRLVAIMDKQTFALAFCTNSKKQYLLAFLEILERQKNGRETEHDDPIFEQFHVACPKCGMYYKDPARKLCMNCINKNAIFKRLLMYFKGHGLTLATMFFCMGAGAFLSLVSPYMGGVILYDKVLNSNAQPVALPFTGKQLSLQGKILPVVLIIFVLALGSLLVGIIQNRASIRLANRVTLKMKLDIFTAMQKLSLSYFNNTQTGRLITRVNYDADHIKNFYTNGVPYLLVNSVTFLSIFVILLRLHARLTLIVLIPIPFIVLIVRRFFPKIWKMHTKIWRRTSALNSFLGDSLNGIRVVKAFAKETEEINRFSHYSERLFRVNLQYNALTLTIFPVMYLLISLSGQAIWGFGGFSVMNGTMRFGELMTFIGYLGMIYGPLEFFASLTEQLTNTANSAGRMFEVLDAVPEIVESRDAVEHEVKGDIVFDNVSFHYKANRPILKNLSFDIKAGENIGLVGHTGSGKSTIVNLITRLYDTVSGNILIDGINVKRLKTDCIRTSIAIVSQEIFLFRGTIADNIRYARPGASMSEIIDAAKAAGAHDFIINLPEGYETQVGTGSRSLSGGEQQRVSIARALLLDPKILILDEATAAMDTETERQIQDALHNLTKGRTTIVIAHRLSTLKDCTRLFAIENGEIVEGGTHKELIEKKGVYYKLYTLQTEAMEKVLSAQ